MDSIYTKPIRKWTSQMADVIWSCFPHPSAKKGFFGQISSNSNSNTEFLGCKDRNRLRSGIIQGFAKQHYCTLRLISFLSPKHRPLSRKKKPARLRHLFQDVKKEFWRALQHDFQPNKLKGSMQSPIGSLGLRPPRFILRTPGVVLPVKCPGAPHEQNLS